jgi:hypothetical protein
MSSNSRWWDIIFVTCKSNPANVHSLPPCILNN